MLVSATAVAADDDTPAFRVKRARCWRLRARQVTSDAAVSDAARSHGIRATRELKNARASFLGSNTREVKRLPAWWVYLSGSLPLLIYLVYFCMFVLSFVANKLSLSLKKWKYAIFHAYSFIQAVNVVRCKIAWRGFFSQHLWHYIHSF